MLQAHGLHHVTAIAADAARNRAFYVEALGLRMVKRTVNFDDPAAWHLYYGNEIGAPGTVMTFFVWESAERGAVGAGQAALTQFAVPRGALAFWTARLADHGVKSVARETVFGEERLRFADPDGLGLALVARDDPRAPWIGGAVGATHALRGFRGATLHLRDGAGVARVLTEALGYALRDETQTEAGLLRRYAAPHGAADVIDILSDARLPAGRCGTGTAHHIAFCAPDDDAQMAARAAMQGLGLDVTEQVDRSYFRAIYARAPGGVLFEVATAKPGFTVDEPREILGEALVLPRRHERNRAKIEAALPPL